jgi:hypothetical protein
LRIKGEILFLSGCGAGGQLGIRPMQGERMAPGTEVCTLVYYYLAEFEKLCMEKSPSSASNWLNWRPPPTEQYKINVDASFYPYTCRGGWGFVAHDCGGNFLELGEGITILEFRDQIT